MLAFRMLECWAYAGLVARMLLPLGLNVRSAELSLKSVMLPPPMDALEREERRVAVWFAFYHDTVSAIAQSISRRGLTISGRERCLGVGDVDVPGRIGEFDIVRS